jgi:ATP phosphoribosyltransferase regulatory subunit
VIRQKASQLRPEREKLQLGAELIGSDSVAAAVEIVNIAIEALQAAGVTGITIDFTLPDLIDALAAGPLSLGDQQLEAVRSELDAKDAGALAAISPAAAAYLPLIEATGPFHAAMDRLEAFDASVGGAIASRIAGLRAIARPIGWDITLTLDPTERHGFEFQNWFGFSIFAEGFIGEIGRGGSYAIARADGADEPAMGFSLYPDPLIDAGFGGEAPRRLFLPFGHDTARAAVLRTEGWHTVAALSDGEDGAAQRCSHWLDGDQPHAY